MTQTHSLCRVVKVSRVEIVFISEEEADAFMDWRLREDCFPLFTLLSSRKTHDALYTNEDGIRINEYINSLGHDNNR